MNNPEHEIARAEQAQQVLNNPLYTQAYEETRTAILEAIAGLPDLRSDHAKDLHLMLKSLEKVRKVMEHHIENGKIAAKYMERDKLRFFKKSAA